MAKNTDRFVSVHSEGSAFGTLREIWVDKATGVNYLWMSSAHCGGLTVLLDRDGKPVVSSLPISE